MNIKKWIIASIVIFILDQILAWIVHGIILKGCYEATAHLWRPTAEMNQMMWLMWLSGLIWAFLFVYIFAKGYEGKGLIEGFRYGIVIGIFFSLTTSLGTYSVQPIGFGLAASWFIFGFIQIIIYGLIAALIYAPKVQTSSA